MCSILDLASRCAVRIHYGHMTGGLGRDGSGSIQDGIPGARAGIRQGWLGGDRSVYHEPKAVSQPRVNMEGGFPFLSGKTG